MPHSYSHPSFLLWKEVTFPFRTILAFSSNIQRLWLCDYGKNESNKFPLDLGRTKKREKSNLSIHYIHIYNRYAYTDITSCCLHIRDTICRRVERVNHTEPGIQSLIFNPYPAVTVQLLLHILQSEFRYLILSIYRMRMTKIRRQKKALWTMQEKRNANKWKLKIPNENIHFMEWGEMLNIPFILII